MRLERPRVRSRVARNAGRKSVVEQITGSSAFKQIRAYGGDGDHPQHIWDGAPPSIIAPLAG